MTRATGARKPRRHLRVENVEPVGAPKRGLATWGEWSALGGLPTFANLVTNSETTPIAAVRRTSGIDGAAERSFADAPLGGPIDNLWWPVPITV